MKNPGAPAANRAIDGTFKKRLTMAGAEPNWRIRKRINHAEWKWVVQKRNGVVDLICSIPKSWGPFRIR